MAMLRVSDTKDYLTIDLGGYRCQLFDLEHRRPMVPVVETGNPSTVRMAMFNGDGLFLALKP